MKNNIETYLYSLIAILFLAICAQLSISLPEGMSEVPITGQSFAVLVLAHLLKKAWASLVCIAYILLGVIGLPLFSDYSSGLDVFTGPSMGYLLGFVASAYFIGLLAEKQSIRFGKLLVQMLLGNGIILIFGFLFLLRFLDLSDALSKGVQPFLLGAALKSILAAVLLSIYYKLKGLMNNKATKI